MRWISAFRNLRAQLAIIIAAAMLPAGLVAVLQAISNAEQQVAQRTTLLESDAYIQASEERDTLVEIRESLSTAARLIAKSRFSRETCTEIASSIGEGHRWFAGAMFLDADGAPVCGSGKVQDVGALSEWREFTRLRRFTIGVPRPGTATGERVAAAYLPIAAADQAFFAVAAEIRLSFLRSLSKQIGGEDRSELLFALVGNDGETFAITNAESDDWLPADTESLRSFVPRTVSALSKDGQSRHYVSHPLVAGQLWALTGAPTTGFWRLLISDQGFAIWSPIILWLIAVGVAYFAIDRLVTRHVTYLRRVAKKIGDGELDTRVRAFEGAPTEIRQLGSAVGWMADNLSQRDEELRRLLATQRSLLLEVHHRVKNNLQMISSLMNLQIRRSNSASERQNLQMVQDRIHGLALVHQSLYATERLDHVALDQLIRDLSAHLAQSLSPSREGIEFEFVLEPVTVDAEVATPVALFLTEAVGNVFKHAITDRSIQVIKVSLQDGEDAFRLSIANAISNPNDVTDGENRTGLGSRLMDDFARQLGGQLSRETENGFFRLTLFAPKARKSGGEFAIRQPDAELEASGR